MKKYIIIILLSLIVFLLSCRVPKEDYEILKEENTKLKKLVADLSLDKVMLQDVLSKNW